MKNRSIFFLLIVTISCSPVGRKNRVKKLFEKGNEMLFNASYDQAVGLYSKALELDPELTDAYMNRGVAYLESGHTVLALADYNEVVLTNPEYYPVYFNRAMAYLQLGRYKQSTADIQLLKQQFPDTAVVYFMSGLVLESQMKHSEALAEFDAAIKLDNSNAELFINRASVSYHLGAFDQAESDLRYSLEIIPDEPNALNVMALLRTKQGNLESADSLIDLALSKIPNQPFYLNNSGYIKLLKGDLKIADQRISQSLVIDENNAWAHRNKGLLYLELKEFDSAIVSLERAKSLDTHVDGLFSDMVVAYIAAGQQSKACDFIRENYLEHPELKQSKIDCGNL